MAKLEKKFLIDGDTARMIRLDPDFLQDELPAAIYSVNFHPMAGFSLRRKADNFELPEHLFGDLEKKVARLMLRYNLNGEISALLSGAKGSGKTLLAHVFCNKALEQGKPVILVDNDFENPAALKEFLCDLGDGVFIFDEFAKNFDEDSQKQMLDFFSGSNYVKRATFVIENRETDINEFMLDRPGRMRFHFRYDKLSLDVVREVCAHHGMSTEVTRNILNYAARALTIGMDTLVRLIEECKLDKVETKEEFQALVSVLNIPSNREVEYVCTEVRFQGRSYPSNGLRLHIGKRNLRGDLSGQENHPLTKAIVLFAQQNPDSKIAAELAAIRNNDYDPEDEDERHEYYWWNFDFRCGIPTFSVGGTVTYICRMSGVEFVVAEDSETELGNIDHLLV